MKGNFEELIRSNRPVLVDFFAEWCGPCKVQAPVLKEIAGELNERVRIIKIDVDKNTALASNYKVQGVPTLMIFKDGESKWRHSGVLSKQQLMAILEKYL